MKAQRPSLEWNATHTPDVQWCLTVLASLNPEHPYFARDYYPSDEELGRPQKKKPAAGFGPMPGDEGREKPGEPDPFLDNLPIQILKKSTKEDRDLKELVDTQKEQIHFLTKKLEELELSGSRIKCKVSGKQYNAKMDT